MAIVFLAVNVNAQDKEEEEQKEEAYIFTIVKENPSTSIKNQYRSGTCWSFSSLGLVEAELLRMGKDTFDLSEMFVVRNTYSDKATKYIDGLNPEDTAISVITRAEILAGLDEKTEIFVKPLLDQYRLLIVDKTIADLSAKLRREHGWKLPDAFQAAISIENKIGKK